jgi:hypothetical protein
MLLLVVKPQNHTHVPYNGKGASKSDCKIQIYPFVNGLDNWDEPEAYANW